MNRDLLKRLIPPKVHKGSNKVMEQLEYFLIFFHTHFVNSQQ